MIIGAPMQFAVEYDLDGRPGGSWLWGRFCYWVGGVRVGDYEIVNSLRDLSAELATIVKDSGKRDCEEFFTLPATTLYHVLTDGLFGPGNPAAVEQCWARFKVTPSYECFDCCRVYLVDHEDKARLVYATLDDEQLGAISEHYLRAGAFDSVVLSAFEEINGLYERAKKEEGA